MTDIIAKKSQFDIIVTRADDRLQVTDPITIKNQIQEINSIDQLGLNTANRSDGSLVTWNSNTNLYDVKPFNTYVTFSWSNTHTFNANVIFKSAILANNSPGSAGQILTSNGNGIYWANSTPYTFGVGLTTNNGVVSVNSVYISTLSSNNATYLGGKIESDLNANSAVYLGGFQSSYFAANSSLANYYLASNPAGYITSSSSITGSANSATYLGGKTEANLNVNSASYAVIANNATYAFGKTEDSLNANSATYLGGFTSSYFASNSSLANYYLATNPAGYITSSASITGSANSATYLGGKTEANLNVNSSVYSTNATFAYTANTTTYVNNKTEANLNVNAAVYSTNATFALNSNTLGGQPGSYYTNATNMSTGTLAEPRLPYRMNQDVTSSANVQFNNLILSGTLLVANGVTSITANNFAITDNMFYLNNGISATITNVSGNGSIVTFTAYNNFASGWDVYVSGVSPASYNGDYPNILFANATHFQVANTNIASYVSGGTARGKTDINPDIGFAAGYNDGTYHHTGFFRDHTNGTWKVFDNYDPEPDNSIYIDQANNSFHLANFMANTIFVGNNTVYSTITSTNFNGSANNTTYVNNKTEANLNVNNAVTANSSTYLGGKLEANLNVNSSVYSTNANFAFTANNSLYANSTTYLVGKTEANLNVNSSVYSTNATFAITANNTTYFGGYTWDSPAVIGNTSSNSANFTTVNANSFGVNSGRISAGSGITSWAYTGKAISVIAKENTPRGVTMSSDGTKMYVIGDTSDAVHQYNLSTAWDVSTAVFNNTFSIAGQELFANDLAFSSDGTKMYMVGSGTDVIYQYTLTVAWDLTTASYASKSFSFTAQETTCTAIAFSSDGTKVYIIGQTNDTVYQYTLGTAWDISTATYLSVSYNIGLGLSLEAQPTGLAFNDTGTKMYVVGTAYNFVTEYNLSTAWNVSSSTYNANWSPLYSMGPARTASGENGISAIYYNETQNVILFIGTTNRFVYQLKSDPSALKLSSNALFVDGFTQFGNTVVVDGNMHIKNSIKTEYNLTVDATASVGAITLTGLTGNVALTSLTTGNILIGGTTQTGLIVVGQSTANQIITIANSSTATGSVKTINIGTGGVAGSNTVITLGTTSGGQSNTILNGAVTVNGAIIANGSLGSTGQILTSTGTGVYWSSTANSSLYSNSATYLGTKSEANLNVNSAVYSTNSTFAFTSNNATNLNDQPASYYSNASNLSTGTIPSERLPSPRVVSIADGISITVNTDITDIATQINTQVSGTLTINPTTGTPRNGQKFILKIQSTNSQTFSWDTSFGGSVDMGLPTSTTGGGQIDYMGFQYDSISTKWHMIAKNFGF